MGETHRSTWNAAIATCLFLAILSKSAESRDLICRPWFGDWSNCEILDHGTFEEPEEINIISTYPPERITRFWLNDRNTQKVKRIPSIFFEKFPNLESIYMPQHAISRIQRNDLCNATNLVTISLFSNQIQEIEDFSFSGLNKTTTLTLSINQLRTIRRDTLAGLVSLMHLDLDENQIEVIEEGAFSFPHLTELNVKQNKLKTISRGVFAVIPPVKKFLAEKNNLTEIGRLLDDMSHLQWIDLNSNPIRDLNFTMFAKLPKLEYLYIALTAFRNAYEEDVATAEAAGSNLTKLMVSEDQLDHDFLLQIHRVFRKLKLLQVTEGIPRKSFSDEKIHKAIPELFISRYTWFDTGPE